MIDGNGGAPKTEVDTLTLTYDRVVDHLNITGQFNSLDLALDMLARARRTLEARWRMEQIRAVQQAAADQALATRIGLHGRG